MKKITINIYVMLLCLFTAQLYSQTYTEVENNNTIGSALTSSQVRKFGPGNFEGTVSPTDSDFWVISRKSDQATQIKLLVHANYVGNTPNVDFRVWEYSGGNWGVTGSVVGTLRASPRPGFFYHEIDLNYQNNLNGSGISNNYYALEVFTTSATPINYSIPFNPSADFPYCYEFTIPSITPFQVNDTDVTLNDLQIDGIDDRYYIVKFSATNSFTDFTDHYIQDQALPAVAASNSYSGSGEHIVYVGTDNGAIQSAMTMTNLQRNTAYYYKVYTYSNCQGYINYNNTGTPLAVTTCPGTVPGVGSVNSVSPTSPTTATINTLGRPAGADTSIGYLVKFSDTNSFTAPITGTTLPTASTDYSGKTGEQVVYTGAVGSAAGTTDAINQVITGLQINTNYYVKVYTYDLCGGTYNFETTGSPVVTTNYVCAAPLSAVTNITTNVTGTTTMDISSFTPPSNASQGTLAYIIKVSDTDAFTAPISVPASSSTAYNTAIGGEQVVYIGSSASPNLSITGLAEVTTYYVKIYAYNTCGGADYFETTGSTSVSITTCGTPTGNSELNSFRTDLHWENRVSPIISNVPTNVEGQVVKINIENSFTDITGALNTLPTADVNYSGSGEQVILVGAFPEGQVFTGHNLLPNTQYFFKIYSYKECAGVYYFSNTSDAIATYTPGVTDKLASNAQINNFTGTAFTLASFTAAPAADNGLGIPKGYIIKMNTVNSFTPHSFRGPIPTPDADYKGGEQVVYVGSSITPNLEITGLTPDTTYYFTVYAYNDSGAPYFLNSYQQVGYEFSIVNNGSLITPTMTFDDVTVSAGDPNFNLNATSDSSGAISYRIINNGDTGTTLSGTNNETVTIGSAGTVIIEASQAATATHQIASKTMILTIDNVRATINNGFFYSQGDGTTTIDLATVFTSNSTGAMTFEIIGEALGHSISGAILTASHNPGSFIIKVSQEADANYSATTEYMVATCFRSGFAAADFAMNFFDFSLNPGETFEIKDAKSFSSQTIVYSIVGTDATGSTIVGNTFTAGSPGTVTLRAVHPGESFYNPLTKDITVTIVGTPQTITFNALSDVTYGDANFNLTATSDSGLTVTYASSNTSVATISGNTVTIVGEGTTTITASQSGNGTYNQAVDVQQELTVNKRAIEVTADTKTKVYGDVDPTLTYQITSGSLVGSDAFTGSLERTLGENIGDYAINQGTLALNSNYTLSFVSDDLSITAKAIEVTADAKSKVYGDADPALTYQITSGSLLGSDAFTGSLERTLGENIGDYAINQGTLALNSNYTLSFVSDDLSITAKAIEVTADAKSKVYGDADPALTYQITSGSLVGSDAFTGSISRVTGDNVGDYAINQGTLALNSNYTLSFVSDDLSITARAIEVTADAKSKTYGDADPALTYQITSGSLSDAFTGSLTRTAGETVGTYAINQGSLALNSNYTISFISDDLSITAKVIEITADAKSKTYGDSDPALTYQITSGSLVGSNAFTGSISRATGETVGTYAINQGTLALNSNYTISFISDDLSITAMAIEVTAGAKSKTYGDADPALTYQITSGSLVGSDAFTGSLTRTAGETVGTYAISQGTLALNSNYIISFISDDLSITAKAIEITADAKSKVYGDADPALTYQITSGSLVGSDTFTGSLTRTAGETVGTYAINQNTLALNSNYTISFISDDLSITAKAIEITADAKSKVYGDADPALTYQITSGSLVGSDAFTGVLERALGENVGTYTINQGTLALNSNYTLSFVSDDLSITAMAIEVTADAKSKTYGDTDPTLTYQITSGSLIGSDAFTGALSREVGQAQGNYAIQQGTLSLGSNYNLTFVPSNLYIDYRFIRVTPAAPLQKTYGDSDPALTWPYVITQGSLAYDDTLETYGTFRVSGENVGRYQIRGLSARFTSNNGGTSSYAITYTNAGSVSLDITPRLIEVTADTQSKAYGDTDPTLTYQITSGSLIGSDNFTGALTRAAGEAVGTYVINQGSLNNGNYSITFVSSDFEILKADQDITFNPLADKNLGDPDFNLNATTDSGLTITYTSSNTSVATVSGDIVTIVGVGTTTITASQTGNTNYNAATPMDQTLTVNVQSLSTETASINNITIYPNPAKDVVNIKGDITLLKQVNIYSTDGKLVKTLNTNFNSIDVSSLNSGLYILHLSDGVKTKTTRLIKD